MILYDKTLQVKGYDARYAKSYHRVCVKCDECQKEYEKIKRDLSSWEGRCTSCVGRLRGKMMGDKFGKTQKFKGKCASCGDPVRTSLKYCGKDACQTFKAESMSRRFSGPSNPAWTGRNICSCGCKKSTGALRCRSCSFSSGGRSGANNGRYVNQSREYYLKSIRIRKILSSLMRNVCSSGGVVKNHKKTKDLLGYSWEEFRSHIESQFEDGQCWENYGIGGWSIDHILPVDWFIKNKVFDIKIVNNLKNLRPMNHIENIKKSKSIEMSDPWSFYNSLIS